MFPWIYQEWLAPYHPRELTTPENTLKGDAAEKREGETKTLNRGRVGSRGGCLKKKEELEPPNETWSVILGFKPQIEEQSH